ncbi:hypothetical protein JCM3765_006627 [Sporobolomyces pararoseus]
MLDKLPDEVLDRVIDHLFTPEALSDLSHLSLFSTRLSTSIRSYRSRHLVFQSSTQVQQYLKIHKQPDAQAKSLIIRKGQRRRVEQVKIGRKKSMQEVEDSVTEEELVQLCRIFPSLNDVRLEEPSFSTLRRRQIGFASNLSQLQTLSIIGRSPESTTDIEDGFNLSAIGQILTTVPQLKHLELRNIRSSKTSLSGIPHPTFQLSSFSLFTSSFPASSQLSWLLSSSTTAESLQTIKFQLPRNVLPYELHSIYWAPIRVTSLSISCENPEVVECIPLHCPHLERLEFNLLSRNNELVDARRLLKNSIQYRRLKEIRDLSKRDGGGMDLRSVAEGLLLYRKKVKLSRIVLSTGRREEKGLRELKAACRLLGVVFEQWSEGVQS